MLQRGSDSLEDANIANPTMLANGVKSAELMNVKDSEKRADKPPKSRETGFGPLVGESIPRSPTIMGARPGGF
jgi:hypothetical protein